MSNTTTTKKKFFTISKIENLKAFGAIGFSIGAIAAVIAGIIVHVIAPPVALVTIPLTIQTMLITAIKKSPQTIELLKTAVGNLLKEQDAETVDSFIDEIVTQFSSANTARNNNEPIADQQATIVPVVTQSATPPQMERNLVLDQPETNGSDNRRRQSPQQQVKRRNAAVFKGRIQNAVARGIRSVGDDGQPSAYHGT